MPTVYSANRERCMRTLFRKEVWRQEKKICSHPSYTDRSDKRKEGNIILVDRIGGREHNHTTTLT